MMDSGHLEMEKLRYLQNRLVDINKVLYNDTNLSYKAYQLFKNFNFN